jgi:hypothetical protein
MDAMVALTIFVVNKDCGLFCQIRRVDGVRQTGEFALRKLE